MTSAIRTCTVDEWLGKAVRFLEARGVPETEANAEFLMAEALGGGRAELHASGARVPTWKQGSYFWEMVKKRGRRIPLAYVLGSQPFCGFEIKVTAHVLVPRPETEQLVELAAAEAGAAGGGLLHIVDVGTGSGCIAVALAKMLPQALLYATEFSDTALRVAEENARNHHLERRIRFLREDLFKPKAVAAPWADIVVSNPPYIPTGELDSLDPEVREEPSLALDGGQDGLEAIRAVAIDASRILKPGGRILLEFGYGQGDRVRQVLANAGFGRAVLRNDLQGVERFAMGRLGK